MSDPMRLLDILVDMADDGPFTSILATTFNFDAEFFVSTGVLTALAGELDRGSREDRRKHSDPSVVRDQLGNPYVGVIQGRPSPSGTTPAWVERFLWPTRRLGVMHAKCLVAVGRSRAHAVVTSANLTEGSWCRNLEVAASWSAPLTPTNTSERRRARAVAEVAGGIASLAGLIEAPSMARVANDLHHRLNRSVAPHPLVVWSGAQFTDHPLSHLGDGEQLVVVSPFWPADRKSSDAVVSAMLKQATKVVAVARSPLGGTVIEVPEAFKLAAEVAGFELSAAQAPAVDANEPAFRSLHAKQASLRSDGTWRSYVGSANATAQGLALVGRANIELGVVVEERPLVAYQPATGVLPPAVVADPDDPSAEDWADSYAVAHLDVTGTLRIRIEPAPERGSVLEVPTGGSFHTLTRRVSQELLLDDAEVSSLLGRPEVTVASLSGGRFAVPVVLDEELKLRSDSARPSRLSSLDDLLCQLARNPTGQPSDDDVGAIEAIGEQPTEGVLVTSIAQSRKPVHRAREAIEVITGAEEPLRVFLANNPPPRLVQLRFGGGGSIVDLARRVAATRATSEGLTTVASAFVVTEIALLLRRMTKASPAVASELKKLTREVETLAEGLIGDVEKAVPRATIPLRKLAKSP